jgi:hypothetical protein
VAVFGTEPPHDWCYYYEKADLARQKGAWDEVLQLGEKAFVQGLAPIDGIEWIPFLQAYADSENVDRLTQIAPIVAAEPYIARQACLAMGGMPGLTDSVMAVVDSLFCLE